MEWIEGSQTHSLSAVGSVDTALELFQNDDDPALDRTVVDGYVTIITDTDDLCQVALYGPAPNFAVASDFTFNIPNRNEPIFWYNFNCGRGPMVFRIRSKRTFGPEEEMWMMGKKLRGTAVTNVHVAWAFLLSP